MDIYSNSLTMRNLRDLKKFTHVLLTHFHNPKNVMFP